MFLTLLRRVCALCATQLKGLTFYRGAETLHSIVSIVRRSRGNISRPFALCRVRNSMEGVVSPVKIEVISILMYDAGMQLYSRLETSMCASG